VRFAGAVITGISELKPTMNVGNQTELDLLMMAAAKAIEDSGLSKKEIDGLIVTPPSSNNYFMWPSQVAEYLNMQPNLLDMVELGGASAVGSIIRAALFIDAGFCNNCLCLSGGIWDRQVFNTLEGKKKVMSQAEIDFELPFGPMGFNSAYALITRRHMQEFGTTAEQLAKIVVDQRVSAMMNENALFNDELLSIEDILASPVIADPIHRLEIVVPCSGAAAVVVSHRDQVKDFRSRTVTILGMGEAYTHNSIVYAPDIVKSPVKHAADKAFAMAGVARGEIDLVSLYDCYPITVLMTLEDAGFCTKGEGGKFVENTDLTFKGTLPCNTHGGQLCCGQPSFAGGMSHVIEAVRQLRNEAGPRQITKNKLAFVNGNGGVMSVEASIILGGN
jgi:acetyl-CoA C-acetyltransferase